MIGKWYLAVATLVVSCIAGAAPLWGQEYAAFTENSPIEAVSQPQPAAVSAQTQASPSNPAAADAQTPAVPQTAQPSPDGSSSSSAQAQKPQTTQQQTSQQQLEQQEHQRILGVMPTFNMTNNAAALPLTPKQKFQLFFRGSTDPFVFLLAGIDSGIGQAENSFPEYGQGAEGYAKRFGASYADTFDGNLWGNAILPSLLHEDPRYYRMGAGHSIMRRFWWAAGSTVWSKRDNGSWGLNYANVGGNLIGGAISNVYYPASQRGLGLTFERAATVTAEGTIGAELVEFWPDIEGHFVRKHREKKAQEAAARDAQAAGAPAPAQTPPANPK